MDTIDREPTKPTQAETRRAELIASEIHRIDDIRPDGSKKTIGKHRKMTKNPFRFFRGAVQLFYHDLATGVLALPTPFADMPRATAIMGDCHLANFGFVTEKGSHGNLIVFSPNDFDDACIGNAGWDLSRFLVSLFLGVDYSQGILEGSYDTDEFDEVSDLKAASDEQALEAARAFLTQYRKACRRVIDDPGERRSVLDKFPKHHILRKSLKKAKKRAIGGKKFETKSSLGKAVAIDRDGLRFRERPRRYRRLDTARVSQIHKVFRPYVGDEILDVIERLGQGTGSVNVKRYYLLVGPAGASTSAELTQCHVVELKQQREAAPITFFPDLDPRNSLAPAHLTVNLQRLMQREPDLLLDEVTWEGAQWLIRSRHHARVSLDPEEVCLHEKKPGRRLRQYAEACGETLALAHSRPDHRSARFEIAVVAAIAQAGEALIETSRQYARRTLEDYDHMKALIASSDR